MDETFLSLRTRFPNLTPEQLADRVEAIRESLTPRQLWLLAAGNPKVSQLGSSPANGEQVLEAEIPDPRPDPETLATLNERRGVLSRALFRLPKSDRLLIRLRFEQGLTLGQALTPWAGGAS